MIISAVTGARTQAPSTGAGPDFWWISMSILTRGRIFYQLLLRGSPSFQCHFLEKGYLDFDLDSDPCLFRYNFFYVKWKCVFQGFSVRLLSFRFVYNVFVYSYSLWDPRNSWIHHYRIFPSSSQCRQDLSWFFAILIFSLHGRTVTIWARVDCFTTFPAICSCFPRLFWLNEYTWFLFSFSPVWNYFFSYYYAVCRVS